MKRFNNKLSCVLVLLTIILIVAGCSSPSEEAVMKNLVVDGENKYAVHLFYKEPMPEVEATDLNKFHNSHPAITDAIVKIQFWDQYQERNIKWAKALSIKDFPMYIIIQNDEIVFQTQYLSLVKHYLSEQLLP